MMIGRLHYEKVFDHAHNTICHFVSVQKLSPAYGAFVSRLNQVQVPSKIEDALQYPNWNAAAFEEIQALEKNNTWVQNSLLENGQLNANGSSL